MKNRKAQAMAVYLVLITMIIMGMAIATFFSVRDKMSKTISPPSDLLEIYDENAKTMFYENEAARLSSQTAFNSIAKEISSGQCSVINLDYVLWKGSCKPDAKSIQNKFLEKFNETYSSFGNLSSLSLEREIIKINSAEIIKNISDNEGYVVYNTTLTFNPSFEYNLSKNSINLDDFDDIYTLAMQCKDKNLTKASECLSGKLERWDFSINSFDKYILFSFKTKKSFLIENKIVNPEIKVAAEI